MFRASAKSALRTHAYLPRTLGERTRLAVVMHGRLRNASEYLQAWTAWAERTDHIVVAPAFDQEGWPGARGYNLGNVVGDEEGGRVLPRDRWAFTALERLCERVASRFELVDPSYSLWGHSAGAQFVHRFLLFSPAAPVRDAIAAGAGWYTVPDREIPFPYGLGHPALSFLEDRIRAWLRRPLTIMRGGCDRIVDADLRRTPEAEAQGAGRWERAGHFHSRALARDPGCNWALAEVPGVGHEWPRMAKAAQSLWDRRLSAEETVAHA